MPLTRAQIAGKEPLVKIKTKIRKTKYSAKIHQLASLKVLEDFKPISKNQFKISKLNCSGHNNFKIDISKKSCTCPFWLKHAICSHSLAFSNLKELSWFGPAYSGKSKKFFTKCKRGRKGGRAALAKSALQRQ